jgi:alkaline phosphatase
MPRRPASAATALVALAVLAAAPAAARSRGVVLVVGDGMGFDVIGLSQTDNELVRRGPPLRLAEAMKRGRLGLVSTRSASHVVTDSAAAATALATGVRTTNDVVGMDADGRPLDNLLELARARGLAVGLVTTDKLTGATPAAFSAHASHRRQSGSIAAQQVRFKPEVMFGGGRKDYDLGEARAAGFRVFTKRDELAALLRAAPDKAPWLGLFADDEFPYQADRGPGVPPLPEMVRVALKKLSADPDGFFLLVESARIDHAEHANEGAKAVAEFYELDDAVGELLAFTDKNPDVTFFVTADHSTGGLSLSRGDDEKEYPTDEDYAAGRGLHWISHNHTADPVLFLGVGPDAAAVQGWRDNSDVFRALKESLGL